MLVALFVYKLKKKTYIFNFPVFTMFRRKLEALNHATPDKVNVSDEAEFRQLVVWLEDQKIRHYKIEERQRLRDTNSSSWPDAFKTYLNDLECPIKSEKPLEELEWLLGFSVRLEYDDNLGNYKKSNFAGDANPLEHLDFQHPDFIKGINSLANILNVAQHPDHLVTLKAVTHLICTRLNREAIQNSASVIRQGEPFPFEESDSGFALSDYVLNKAAKVLRLLYIHDLRELQTKINELIVAVQDVTANPKTDTKLGQVGR